MLDGKEWAVGSDPKRQVGGLHVHGKRRWLQMVVDGWERYGGGKLKSGPRSPGRPIWQPTGWERANGERFQLLLN